MFCLLLMDYNLLINKMKIKYYDNLIKYGTKNNYDVSGLKNLKNDIVNLIEMVDSESASEENKVKDIIYSDDYLYQKPWTKISQIHKIIKIKEFVNKLLINNGDEKDKLINDLSNRIRSRELTKRSSVNYDSVKGIIVSIPNLEFKNNKYYYKG